ncbi:MAG: hypothetical protein E7Z86_10735 [Methanosphaera stadtmanae]|nr:hypothetical protein [Methanosphaera stadtmanae]
MKKSLIILLCGILTISMIGCGSNSQTTSSKSIESTQSTSKNVKESKSTDTIKVGDKEVPKEIKGDSVVLDNENYKITYIGIDNSNATGAKVKLKVENKLDKNITVQVENVSLDNEMVDTICSIEVTPGKQSSNSGITLTKLALDNSKALKLEGTFRIKLGDDAAHPNKEQFSFEIK